ncbi:MAG: DUF4870 domain-containing protein [Christensenellales bacterium]|jgi:uncharacterized membrane protein
MSDQKNSLGMDEKTASWFAYILSIISAIILLATEKDNKTVRLHAWQSLFLGCAAIVIGIVLVILSGAFVLVAWGLVILFSIISWLIWIAFIVITVICIIKAVQGDIFKIPVIYGWAEKMK